MVASAVFALTLITLQLIFHYGYDDKFTTESDSVFLWLFRTHLGFWGPGAFDPDETEVVIANVSGGVVLLVLVFLLVWLAIRGTAPGSASVPGFLSIWGSTMIAAPVAAVVITVIRVADDDVPMGPLIAASLANSDYGLKWGWIAALIASLAWVVARPSPAPAAPAYTPPPPMPTTTPADGTHVSSPADPPPPPPTTSFPDPSA
jgi:hypothetical protein